MNTIGQFHDVLKQSIEKNTFAKLSLGDYRGEEKELKKIILKRVFIKKKDHLSFVYRYKTRDITKNFLIPETIQLLQKLISEEEFCYAHLCTTGHDFKLQRNKKRAFVLRKEPPTIKTKPTHQHDKQKLRKIKASGDNYLHALGITNADGQVKKSGQDKYRQINHYIEILSSLLKDLPKDRKLIIVDMGSGKGYLTFALYDYVINKLNKEVQITGVEYREDLVTLCNEIAKQSKFDKLHFVQGTIQNFETVEKTDVLIALHACDTATDDAIYKGIKNNAELIVVAPCCHKQIRKEITKNKKQSAISQVTKHGIFLERQAEMVTDTLRALYLEHAGYATKVFEFISTAHTPKNVLIVGQKRNKSLNNQKEVSDKIADLKDFFGVNEHFLGNLLGLDL